MSEGEWLRVLEALRLGVVPAAHVERYTVGRDGVMTGFRADLNRSPASGSLRVVFGDYGAGKSHLLEWMRQEALSTGHLAARATLDDRDVSPAFPKRVYHALAASLTYPDRPDRAQGLAPLFDTLVASGRAPRKREDPLHHRYLDAVLAYLTSLDPDADRDVRRDLLDWIEGHPAGLNVDWNKTLRGWARGPYLLTLPDYRTFAHIYAYLVGGISVMAREAGHKGLVLLLDEAEFYEVLGKASRAFAEGLLAALAIAALGPAGVLDSALCYPRGGQEVHRQISPAYAPDQPLHIVLFLTPVRGGTEALCRIVDLARHRLDLPDLLPDDYRTLFDRVVDIYGAAHPEFKMPADLARPMGDLMYASVGTGILPNPRAALRLIVEFLDVARLNRPRLLDWLEAVGERLSAA